MGMLPLVLVFGVFYFLVIRPQSKRQKETRKMLAELRKGDDVVTTGGLFGRITAVRDADLTLQIAKGVEIRVLRSSISNKAKEAAEEEAKGSAKESEKSDAKPDVKSGD